MIKKISLLILCGLLNTFSVYANDFYASENGKTPIVSESFEIKTPSTPEFLDISSGIVIGKNADYSLELPNEWLDNLIIERKIIDTNSNSQILLEELNFYCKSANKASEPYFLMSLLVFNKVNFTENPLYVKIQETDNFVFSVYLSQNTNLPNNTDQILFNYYYLEMNNLRNILNIIKVSDNELDDPLRRVFTNGQLIEGAVVFREDYRPYVPIRDVCEVLGYDVKWTSNPPQINVSKNGKAYNLHIDDSAVNYGAYIVNNKTYISDLFFIHILKANVEIDARGNVYIMQN